MRPQTAQEVYIAGLRKGNGFIEDSFPDVKLENELWAEYLKEEDTIEEIPATQETSDKIFSEVTEIKIKRGDKYIPLEMNDEGEL